MKILNIAVPNCMEYRPNPQPLPFKGRGVRFKASLLLGATVYTQVELPPLIPPCKGGKQEI